MAAPEPLHPPADELPLRDGRTLRVAAVGRDELVEVRSSTGSLELRVRLTADGPVLEMESVRLVLRAEESVDVETRDFNVRADGEVRITGDMIHLN